MFVGVFMSKSVTLSIIGAGNRGRGIFGQYALEYPHRAKVVAVVEPDPERRMKFAQEHHIEEDKQYSSSDHFFDKGKQSDGVIIATQESQRLELISEAMRCGYHLLVEKPLACSLEDTIKIYRLSQTYHNVFGICHQMRYIPAYALIKTLIESGKFGDLITIQHSENLSYHHMAHSFVRGPFNNDAMTPMILAKSCHDMDILRYFVDKPPIKISSFGSLSYFKKENVPVGAPAYCLDGCPNYSQCPYHVLKLYFNEDTDPAYIRQMGIINSKEQLFEVLKHNCFGRCVFKCDNNVVDHQVVNIEFADGVTACFQMAGHNYVERRIIKLSLTNGEIYYDASEGIVKSYSFSPLSESFTKPAGMEGSHMGGDKVIMDSFVDAVLNNDKDRMLTSVKLSLESHLLAFAAEIARKENRVVCIKDLGQE